ncbi:restriction endonuclease subunit S [Coprobacillus sp. AF36-10BH]|nr:restriction endonuclease subunit S [Coprobacillus sp. AF36-10BH]
MSKPKIRFKRFTDDWEQRKLGTLCSLITKGTTPKDKSGNGEVNFIKVENIDIDNGEITSTSKISIAEHEGYLKRSKLKENDILFSIAGTLGRVSVVKSSILPANTNQALAILRINEGYIPYLTTVLKGQAVEDFIRRNPTIGAQPNLSLEQVNNLDISYPNYDEQVRIGQYFSNLDHLITLHQRKYNKLVNIKKSMIEKMFPQNGACVPEIRFKGFTDDWEQRKLGEVGSVSMCRRIFKEQTSESGDIPFYKIGTFGGQADAYISRELFAEYRSKYPYPKEGDILISASGSIGRTVEFTGKNEYFQDSNIVWLSHDDRLDNTFLKYFYSVVKWAGIEGSTIKRLYNDNILNTVISMPSVAEQRKIGTFFKKLDNLITLHQRKIEKLKNIKKSCLEKMFV